MAGANRAINSADSLSGAQRAAVLVMYLEHPVARALLQELSTTDLQGLGAAMAEVENIAPSVIEDVVGQFVQDLYQVSLVPKSGPDFALRVLPELLDSEQRSKVIGPIKRRLSKSFEEYVSSRPARTVAAILRDEHAQTQALACVLMGSNAASRIFSELDERERYDLAMRMARIDRISSDLADDIETAIISALNDQGSELWDVKGIDRAAQTLGKLDMEKQEHLLGQIADEDFDLSEKLRRRMVVFEDLKVLDDRSVQSLLKNVDREVVVVALRGADALMREVFLGNMSKRAAQDLREELEFGSPLPKAQVVDAQEEIVNTALRLKEEGLLSLPVGGGDEELM